MKAYRDPSVFAQLDEDRIAAYVAGELGTAERQAIERALDEQPEWLEVVAALAASGIDGASFRRAFSSTAPNVGRGRPPKVSVRSAMSSTFTANAV